MFHTQRLLRFTGQFDPCVSRGCGRQPNHVERNGEHRLECPGCGTATAWFPMFHQASLAWQSQAPIAEAAAA